PLTSLRPVLLCSSLALLVSWGCGGDDSTTTPRTTSTSGATTSGAGGAAATSGPTGSSTTSSPTTSAGTSTGTGGSTGAGGTGGGGMSAPAEITTIAIYQGVQINLMKDGQAVSKLNGPIVKDRPALVRVWVKPGAGFTPHDVSASLELAAGPKMQTVNV